MEEQKVDTTKTISKEEFRKELEEGRANIREKIVEDFLKNGSLPRWNNYDAVSKFKSVRRAIRRGHVDLFTGIIYPKRPFSNKKPTKGRETNELKKRIYELYKAKLNK